MHDSSHTLQSPAQSTGPRSMILPPWMLRRRSEPQPWSRRPAYANPPVEMERFASNFPRL